MVALLPGFFRRVTLLAAALVLSVSVVACGAKPIRPRLTGLPRTGPPVTVGVNTDITWGIPPAAVRQEIQLMRRARLTWVRATVDLSGFESSAPGQIDWSYMRPLDRAVREARRAGLQVLIEADRTPYWASADPHKYTNSSGEHWDDYWAYRNPADYGRIMADLVRHFRPMGVRAFELWNEPNFPRFWPSGVNAAAYTQLLKAAYPAIKRVDPKATVVMGGLSNIGVYQYLQALYRAGAARYYDVANFHIYPQGNPPDCHLGAGGRPAQNSFCLLDGLRREMLANGDDKPAILTELGWSTCSSSQCVSQQQQAQYLKSAFKLLSDREYSWIPAVFIYAMRDVATFTSTATWGSSLGLVTKDMRAKPAYATVRSIATRALAASKLASLGELVPTV